MTNLLRSPGKVIGMVFATALFAMAQGRVARPGTINYVEGQVTLDGQSISPSQLGSVELKGRRASLADVLSESGNVSSRC